MTMHFPPPAIEALATHLIMNYARRVVPGMTSVPALLGLAGPPGSGKTSLCKFVAEKFGVHLEIVPSSVLGGMYAGQSTVPVREAIVRASQADTWQSAVLIDDYDLSEARVDDNLSGTINAPLLNGTLMNYADNPSQLTIHDDPEKPVRVVPLKNPPVIFVTCNDMSKLYAPLTREGRMKPVVLDPQGAEVLPIVQAMYPKTRAADIARLVGDYPDASIAFFKQLGLTVAENQAKAVFRDGTFDPRSRRLERFAHGLAAFTQGADFEQLAEAAKQLSRTERGKNYLKPAA